MDPNFDFFTASNPQDAESSSAAAAAAIPPTTDGSIWDPALALGMSDEVPDGPSHLQQSPGAMFGNFSSPSFGQTAKPQQLGSGAQCAPAGRRRDGHEKKRARIESDAAALDSVDYWINFDDDDLDNRLGSFEIDFSGARNNASDFSARPMPSFNTMVSTPGLGTGLYSTANNTLFREDDFLDDTALDNALSDDEEALDSINLADHLSKIDSAPPAEVPPREGLYSTPLSWEKPQPGLRADPLMGFNPGTPLLSDMEQKQLLAIALNTTRPPPANFGPGSNFGTGFGFGYGYDAMAGGGYPSLGANSLLETFGTPSSFSEMSKLATPKPPLQVQAPSQPSQLLPPRSTQSQTQQPQAQPQPQSQDQIPNPQNIPSRQDQQLGLPRPPQTQPQQPPPQAQPQSQPLPQARPPPPDFYGKPHLQKLTPAEADNGDAQKHPAPAPTAATTAEKGKEKPKSGDRAAHNDIERKYRTNLKDKISELRDAVPVLRSIPEEGVEEVEDAQAQQRGPKVSKGTVLTKATEYIHLLERRNKAIMREHQDLSRRLQAFEQLLNATARQISPMPNYSRALFDPRGFC